MQRYWRREDDGTYGSHVLKEILKSNMNLLRVLIIIQALTFFGRLCHSNSTAFCVSQKMSTAKKLCPCLP